MEKLYEIKIPFSEVELLDGKVSETTQKTINEIKKEYSYGFDDLPILNEILKYSEKDGKLKWTYKQIKSCSYCDKKYDYYIYPRSGHFHNKGDRNYDKPKYYSGIKFNEGFITISGLGDMCTECAKKYNVIHRLIDYIIDNDLKIEIQKNDYKPSKYLKDEIKECFECGKEMKESEMGRKPTLMGDGSYPSKCPHCGAESLALSKSHKLTDKFSVRDNHAFKSECQELSKLVKDFNNNSDKDNTVSFYNKENNFTIQEDKWSNGHNIVVEFNVLTKIYKKGFFWKDEYNIFEDILIKDNYKAKS